MSNRNSPISTPFSNSDPNCNKEKNFLLKRHGLRGVIVAFVVVGVALVIILISKYNDIRLQRIPMIWRNRIKTMVKGFSKFHFFFFFIFFSKIVQIF